eukprot:c32276_g1_i1.p1 GENE.c32276_g1_i1~~c32276_g1_i1.p1  ORF type:complete len:200 (+),score=35.98 c32276_g1_i1:68-667(+)
MLKILFVFVCGALAVAPRLQPSTMMHRALKENDGPIDPDAGIVIDWAALDSIVANYTQTPPDAWIVPNENCSSIVNASYLPLFCPWFLKPYRDPWDLVVTEVEKFEVYRVLLGVSKDQVSHGLPVAKTFGSDCCGVFENTTMAYVALSAFDLCWYETDELQRCISEGHGVPRHMTKLTELQYGTLIRNASYADKATPHL